MDCRGPYFEPIAIDGKPFHFSNNSYPFLLKTML